MLRPKTSTCLFCSFRIARKALQNQKQWPPQQIASLKTVQITRTSGRGPTGRPNRMSLAPANTVTSAKSKTSRPRRKQDGPFGGMNLKVATMRNPPRTTPLGAKTANKRVDFKALKMQRALVAPAYQRRTKIKEEIADITFDSFPLLPTIQTSIPTQGLNGMTDLIPTPVQKIAIPALLGEMVDKEGRRVPVNRRKKAEEKKPCEEFLIAAETGSGKTLAYLLPTINAIKIAEAQDEDVIEYEKLFKQHKEEKEKMADWQFKTPIAEIPHPTTGRPRAIILVPTSELVAQVGALVKSFSHTVKFRSAMISSSFSGTVIRNRLFSPKGIDIVVSTPYLLSSMAESNPNILSRVTHLIVDEADSLMDRGFAPLTSAILDRVTPSLKQLILCSATIPKSLDTFLRTRFPDIRRLTTPNLHAIPRRVQLGVVDITARPYQGDRQLACADTIWNISRAAADHDGPVKGLMDVKRILVFVNERETTSQVADYLVTKGIDAIALNRDTPEQRKSEMLASFTSSEPLLVPKSENPGTLQDVLMTTYVPAGKPVPKVAHSLPNVKVIVTTDLGSRGIDTLAVRNVILYDVPHSTIDFIHRLGRTGRMGRRGRALVLEGRNDKWGVVAEVKKAMFRGQALI